jgi:hypothetical protein
MRWTTLLLILAAVCGASCKAPPAAPSQTAAPAPPIGSKFVPEPVREIVERFGQRLRNVSVLGPPQVVRESIRREYGELVTPDLLQSWLENPRSAPGRLTSSPWPGRIEIIRIREQRPDRSEVYGEIIEVTNAPADSPVRRIPVWIELRRVEDRWRIAEWSAAAPQSLSENLSVRAAVAVIEAFYDAINKRDYERAYGYWGSQGRDSGQTLHQFRKGFAETESVRVQTGDPGRIDPAAGSRYVKIPVEIAAQTTRGETQRFRGTYTLRRGVVEEATPQQQQWHIISADIRPVPPEGKEGST